MKRIALAALLIGYSFSSFDAHAQTIIWSEDFESYADGDVIAVDNNGTNPAPDWSFSPGSMTNKVFATNPITGNLSFYHRQGISTWTTETIDISGYTNVSISLNLKEQTCESGDKIETFYSIDGAVPIEFGDGNGDAGFNLTSNIVNNLNGNSLVLTVVTTSDAVDDKHKFDDILIEGTVSMPGVDVVTACDSFTWIDGNTYNASNNSATYTLVNSSGGDSIVSLDLTILNSSIGADTITACGSYTWIDGITYTTSNNTATDTLTNSVGCDSIITLNLTILELPDNTTTLNGTTITANNATASYQWLDCDNNFLLIPGQSNQSFTPALNGNYAVRLTENGCIDTSSCVTINTISIIENTFASDIKVYPNPTHGAFFIDLGMTHPSVQLTLTDISGKLIWSKLQQNSQVIDLAIDQQVGIYLLLVQSQDHRAVIRIIKE